ncbi:hypothetical protein GGR50DRAFT_690555 [Xylaria sp. CBS 124048]|nr:hypothetical protein GGR50DRAFT_690555 [Xylaria sp. CBS 124048]
MNASFSVTTLPASFSPSSPVSSSLVVSSPVVSSPVVSSPVVSATFPVLAAAANVSFVTHVVSSYETYCPGPTQITYGANTYTVTEATTLTITDCPCTVSMPVMTTSAVHCSTCSSGSARVIPTLSAPIFAPVINATAVNNNFTASPPTVSPIAPAGGTAPNGVIPVAAAGKVAAMSGAILAGLVGVVAFIL